MAGLIPDSFIDDLLTRVDIVDVIDSRVKLKRAGREYQACCPFHEEKTPSFTVSPQKQFYHCFGCGAHGSAIGFLMNYDRMEFIDAVEDLAKQAGVEVPREAGGGVPRDRLDPLFEVLDKAAHFFQQHLKDAPVAIAYLKKRGLTGEVAQLFGIGYAPDSWDALRSAQGQDDKAVEVLRRAGLVVRKEKGGHYDRFRNRIMFPIRDRRGRVVAFGGRVLDDSTPKYLNSPETPVFHKGRELYGLYEVRQAHARPERILVVEGYMDVVALAQHGIDYAVATLGTATTSQHAEHLYRATDEVVFAFDGDDAGRRAAWRALENVLAVLKQGRQARFLFLPEGHDPDSLVRSEGADEFTKRLADSVPGSRFLFGELQGKVDMGSLDGRSRLVELMRPLIARMPEGAYREAVVERLAHLAQISLGRLDAVLRTGETRGEPSSRRVPRRPGHQTPVKTAITHLLARPDLAGRVENLDGLRELDVAGAGLLADLLELLASRPDLNAAAVIETWPDREAAGHLAKLASWSLHVSDEGLEQEFDDAIGRLQGERSIESRMGRLLAKPLAELSPAERTELKELQAAKARLHQRQKGG